MKAKTQWIAEDGRAFEQKEDCELHEKVVCPVTGIIQQALRSQAITVSVDNFPKLFSEILVDRSDEVRALLAKVGGIKARRNKSQG